MSVEGAAVVSDALRAPRERIDGVLATFLRAMDEEVRAVEPQALPVLTETARLIQAGGKRLRPAFCYWGFRAGGGTDGEPIVRASAALELLHTMALIHDDLMDGATERRGVPASAPSFAAIARGGGSADAEGFGLSAAVLAGDLAAVLADRLFLESGFAADVLVGALAPYHEMRVNMALGQYLDVAGLGGDPDIARKAARLKGGAYSVGGPLQVGAALAEAGTACRAALRAYGDPLGEAFQLRDDLQDGEAASGITGATVDDLVRRARAALSDAPIDGDAAGALDELASSLVAIDG